MSGVLGTSVLCVAASWLASPPIQESTAEIQTLAQALDQLPPIETEGTWHEDEGKWTLDPAVLWLKTYLEGDGVLDDAQWRRLLVQSHAMRMRGRWPVDAPLAVCVEPPACLGQLIEIRLTPSDAALGSARGGRLFSEWCGNCADAHWSAGRYQELGKLGLGRHEVAFEVVVERGAPDSGGRARPRGAPPPTGPSAGVLWKGSLTFPIEVVPTLDEAMPAVHGAALDSSVRSLLELTIFEHGNLVVRAAPGHPKELASVAVSLELELLDGAEVVESDTL